jgi:enoyl-[acyl-carrier-protein] reductase (NADH)
MTIAARTPRYNQAQQALASIDAAPVAMVTACRNGIVEAAIPHGAVRVDAVSAGSIRTSADGQIAPLVVRIVYDRQGGYEIREAKVNCALDPAGAVTAVT